MSLTSAATPTPTSAAATTATVLSTSRLHAMRAGYLLMGVGLAVVKWPLLPVLLFESVWKLLWLGLVALPKGIDGTLDAATREVMVNSALVVVILAVTPWPHVWRHYVRGPGDRWR